MTLYKARGIFLKIFQQHQLILILKINFSIAPVDTNIEKVVVHRSAPVRHLVESLLILATKVPKIIFSSISLESWIPVFPKAVVDVLWTPGDCV